nr:PREDICTED: prominin-2-like [Apteryx mantelli mantelli]
MYQKQGRRSGCRRRALYASVLLVSAVLLAGDVCAFISNSRLSQAVSGTFPNVNATAGDLRAYLASIPEQINFIAASSDVPLGIGPTLGGVIISGIRRSVNEAVGSLQSLLGGSGPVPAGAAGPLPGHPGGFMGGDVGGRELG